MNLERSRYISIYKKYSILYTIKKPEKWNKILFITSKYQIIEINFTKYILDFYIET